MAGRVRATGMAASAVALIAAAAAAQDRGISYTITGTPGLLQMPTAIVSDEGALTGTVSLMDGQVVGALSFQVTDALTLGYRLAATNDFSLQGDPVEETYSDRSFDLRYSLLAETQTRPGVVLGINDIFGSGQFGAEYIVATKALGDAVRVSAGLGWGRLGSDAALGAIGTRGAEDGNPLERYFRGDVAAFGGVEWAPLDRWTFKAEYSTDASTREAELGLIERDSPLNFGVVWNPLPGVQVAGSYLYGNTFGLTTTVTLNANERPMGPMMDPAPVPVSVRPAAARAATGWDRAALPEEAIAAGISTAMASDGIILTGIELTDTTARLRYTNTLYRAEAQALGRVARILTGGLPPSIEVITLEPVSDGIPMSAITLRRTDLEALETVSGGTEALLARTQIGDAGPTSGLSAVPPGVDRFDWGVLPYIGIVSGGDSLGLNGGAEVSASYAITPGLVVSAAVRQQLFNTADPAVAAPENGDLFPVRSNAALYAEEGTTTLPVLTLAYFGRPAPGVYSRVTAGLLEPMYGGVSAEVLYKPAASALGFGAELNYVAQRDFDGQFAFRDYEVVTGHGSVYYEFDAGYYAQMDVGRYLAGDWGATLTLDRTFENGWRVGASATVTEVAVEEDFASGVDYGVRLTVPVDFFLGRPTQRTLSTSIGASTRDDGQRLEVDGRLYDTVRGGQADALTDSWGRFWR